MSGIEPGWLWLAAGLALAAAEIAAPGVFLIWIGAAAALTGVLTLASGVGLEAELALFAATAIASVLIAQRWFRGTDEVVDALLNEPGARLLGQIVVAIGPVDHGGGRVRVADGAWPARSFLLLADGARARVVSVDDGCLLVAPLEEAGAAPIDNAAQSS